MKSKRLISAVLASLGAFGSLKAAGGGKNNTELQSGGSEVLINKNTQSRNKLQGVGNSKPSVKNSKTKMKMLGARKPNISDSQQKRRGKNVGKGNKNVNFVDKSLKDNNSARKRSWSTPQKATAGVVGGLVGTTLVVGSGYGIYRWVNGAPCELLKNMDVSGLVKRRREDPYCIKVKYKEEDGTIYYHCYKFFLVFEYEKDKNDDNRNNCYIYLKIVDENRKDKMFNGTPVILPVDINNIGYRFPRWKAIHEKVDKLELEAINKALDIVLDKIIENETQYMKDKNNNELYKGEHKKELKEFMVKMIGNNFGASLKGAPEHFYFDALLSTGSISKLKNVVNYDRQEILQEVGNIGDCPSKERSYLCDDEIDSDGEDD